MGFCRALTDRVEMLAGLMGLSLEFRCDRSIHIIAMDPDRLERLVLNLLSNAFKFTPRGGRVTLEVAVAPRYVELRVTDTGRGIPPEELETVFDRYRQGERVDPPPHGLGLGLPICRRIAWGARRDHPADPPAPGRGPGWWCPCPTRRRPARS